MGEQLIMFAKPEVSGRHLAIAKARAWWYLAPREMRWKVLEMMVGQGLCTNNQIRAYFEREWSELPSHFRIDLANTLLHEKWITRDNG